MTNEAHVIASRLAGASEVFPVVRQNDWDSGTDLISALTADQIDMVRGQVDGMIDDLEHRTGDPMTTQEIVDILVQQRDLRFEVNLEFDTGSGEFDEYEMGTGRFISRREGHSFSIIVWRWGVYIAWRGRRIEGVR